VQRMKLKTSNFGGVFRGWKGLGLRVPTELVKLKEEGEEAMNKESSDAGSRRSEGTGLKSKSQSSAMTT
jgi:hypothetical protein